MKDEIRWTKRNKIDSLKFIVKTVSFFPLFTPLNFHVKRDERAIITREVAVTGRSYQRGRKREAVRSSRPDSESVKPADPIPRLTVRIKFVHPAHNDCNVIHSPLSEFRDRALRHFPVSNSLPPSLSPPLSRATDIYSNATEYNSFNVERSFSIELQERLHLSRFPDHRHGHDALCALCSRASCRPQTLRNKL